MPADNSIDRMLKSHAEGLAYIQAQTADMALIYDWARARVMDLIINHAKLYNAPYTGKYLVMLSEQLQKEYAVFEEKIRSKLKDAIPHMAKSYYFAALTKLGIGGNIDVLGNIDKERIKYMVDSAFNDVAGATKQMRDVEIRHLRNISAKVFRETALTGETRSTVSRKLLNEAISLPGFRFIDKAGRKWDTKSYFDMLGRTVLMNAGRSGYLDACAANGNDIVRVTVSAHPCPRCAVFENRLLSISGKTPGLPTVDYAISRGLFHPNCTHSLVAVPPAMVDKYYNSIGRTNTGVNSPGREEVDNPEAWSQYRKTQTLSKRKSGPMADILGLDKVNLEGIPSQWRSDIENHMAKLYGTYDNKLESIGMRHMPDSKGSVTGGTIMHLNTESFSNRENYVKELKDEIKDMFKVNVDKDKMSLYTPTHEFGHTVFNTAFSSEKLINEMKNIRGNYLASLQKADNNEFSKIFLSNYARKNLNEFFTEGFTQYILNSNPTLVAREIGAFVEKYLRKSKNV